jgi:hypothetical protein
MRRFTLALGLTLLATTAFGHGRNINIHDDDAEFGDCSSSRISFDGERAAIQREELPAAGLRALKVRSGNGAVSVRGGAAWSIVACKAAEDESGLRNINVRLSGDELSADGPGSGDRDWLVFYYITAPRGADLQINASNGPVSVRDVDGTLNLRAKNGPLSLKNLTGRIDAETQNGPISVTGSSGELKLSATNGPLSVKLAGAAWNGTLDASTKNGPLSVSIPRGYRSGILVEALGHGPVRCKAEGCGDARAKMRNDDDWDDDEPRTFEFGSGPRTVHLSTVNGPVTIKESEE